MKILALSLFLFTLPAQANPGPKFGPEFTFAQANGLKGEKFFFQIRKLMYEHLVLGQSEKNRFWSPEPDTSHRDIKYPKHYHSPDNWWFDISTDEGVVEVGMKPMTVDEFGIHKDRIQDAVFNAAKYSKLYPALFAGGGHISMDFSYFKDKPLLYRNFIVDLYNHNELFLGVFSFDSRNAFSLSLLEGGFHEEFEKTINAFDIMLGEDYSDIEILGTDLASKIYFSTDTYRDHWAIQTRSDKTVAINFDKAHKSRKAEARLELRGFRPQMSADVYYRQIRLIRNRLRYLQKFTEPIAIKERIKHLGKEYTDKKDYWTPPVDPQEAMAAFYDYVTEAGEKWEDHQDYLWPMWVSGGEVKKFNASLGGCEELLKAR